MLTRFFKKENRYEYEVWQVFCCEVVHGCLATQVNSLDQIIRESLDKKELSDATSFDKASGPLLSGSDMSVGQVVCAMGHSDLVRGSYISAVAAICRLRPWQARAARIEIALFLMDQRKSVC